MPTLRQAQQLKQFVDEIFEVSKDFWTAQSRSKDKDSSLEISETEFLSLDYLIQSEHPVTVGEIQRAIGVLPAQMSRVIRSLENKSEEPMIRCTINAEDKRKIDVELTEHGRKAHETYRRVKLGSIEAMLLGMSEKDREDLMRILRQIQENMRKALSAG